MTTWDFQEKSGTGTGGWTYNDVNLTYNQVLDPDTGTPVYYNGFGSTPTWTLQTKS